MFVRLRHLSLLILIAGPCVACSTAPTGTVVPITAEGAARNILFLAPEAAPAAAVVMFPGGDGVIGISNNGAIANPGNFLIRTRAQWRAQGFLFVAVDAAEGAQKGDRVGAANLRAIAQIVRAVRERTTAPIWLVGSSAGAPAAVAGAAALPPRSIAGIVISSPVSVSGPRDSVFDVPLARITVPVLIQVDRGDQCRLSPPSNAPQIKAALTAAPIVEVQQFAGGAGSHGSSCGPRSPHGFFGIETQVVDAAADWIRAH
jgi:pimeloyl-ACP methyl ester carboxylesterase